MANFGLGLAQGFQLGTQIGEAMRRKRMREAFEEAQKDKLFRKYTPAQGEQMRLEAGTVEQPGEYIYEIEPGSITYTKRRRGLGAEDEAQLLAAEAARDLEGRPYYSVTRDAGGATVRPLVPTEGGGFSTIGPDTSDPRDVLNYPFVNEDMRRRQSDALIAREEGMLRPVRFTPSSESTAVPGPGATQYLGETYGAEGLTPAKQRSALMNRYADIISKYESPVEGEKFRSMARAEERAEETYGLMSRKAQREEKEALDMLAVNTAISDYQVNNPNATPMEIYDHIKKQKLSPTAINKVVAEIAGVGENELKMYNTTIDKIITKSGGSYAALKKAYNDNPLLDPTTNIVDRKNKDGKLVMDFVSADDPNKVLSSYTFDDETEAAAFLAANAKNPVVAAEMLVNTKYKKSQIKANEGLEYYRRMRGARGGGSGRDYSATDAAQRVRALTSMRSEYSRDAERLRDRLDAMRPNDPNREVVTRQYNDTLYKIDQLDAEMSGYSSGGGGGLTRGGGAAPERYEPGKVYSFRDEKGNVKNYRLKEGKTGAAPEDWEEDKGAPAPKAEAEAKAAPAKEEPPKKDTTKYIREKSPRGNYVYTESPRGMTKEQWAQLDEEKKRK
jgi:hypothetical protein